jgi:butyrate response factor 1
MCIENKSKKNIYSTKTIKPYKKISYQRKNVYYKETKNQKTENLNSLNKTTFEFSKNYFQEDKSLQKTYSKNNKIRNNSKDYLSSDSTSNEDREEKFLKNKNQFKPNPNDFKVKYKTELCKYYEINGFCKFGDNCAYAHGKENLRAKVTNSISYKTKKCVQFFVNGFCPYGNRCQFDHALKSNIINNPSDNNNISYIKTMKTLSKFNHFENLNINEIPRLKIFENIVPNVENVKSELVDNIKELINDGKNGFLC